MNPGQQEIRKTILEIMAEAARSEDGFNCESDPGIDQAIQILQEEVSTNGK